jgi:hypothetical protein
MNSETKMTDNDNNAHIDLGRIATWLDEFIQDDTDTTYMAFLRLLRDYHSLQADAVDAALEREKLKND